MKKTNYRRNLHSSKKKIYENCVEYFISLLTVLIFTNVSYTQSPQWIVYNNDSIPDIYTHSWPDLIKIDNQNNKWLDWVCLTKFDGNNWSQIYKVNDSSGFFSPKYAIDILGLIPDYQNSHWFWKRDGIIKLTPGVDTVWFGVPNIYDKYGDPRGMACDGNYLWIGTSDSTLVRYDGTNWLPFNQSRGNFPLNGRAYVIGIDGNGFLWAFVNDTLIKWDRNENLTIWQSNDAPLDFYRAKSISLDKQNNLWFGYWGSTLVELTGSYSFKIQRFDGTNWTVYDSTDIDLERGFHITSVSSDALGIKWLGTSSRGLLKYDDTTWTVYNTSNSGLPDNWINDVAIDSLGNIWVATHVGLACFNENGIETKTSAADDDLGVPTVNFYPNPGKESVKVRYSLAKDMPVSCEIYDLAGRMVSKVFNSIESGGSHEREISTSDLVSGTYIFKMRIGNRIESKQVIIK